MDVGSFLLLPPETVAEEEVPRPLLLLPVGVMTRLVRVLVLQDFLRL